MAIVIAHNNTAMLTLGELNKNTNALGKQLKKVSSGMKINSAADDASGYAISERMRVQIRSLDQDWRNTQTGTNLLNVADGAVSSTVEILRTMKEKAINAANDTNTDSDRASMQKEYDQLIDQIDDNANVTFNGRLLVDGSNNRKVIATQTSLTNNSLSTNTTGQTAFTAIQNRQGENLGIDATDTVEISWTKNGETHSASVTGADNIEDLLEAANSTVTTPSTTTTQTVWTVNGVSTTDYYQTLYGLVLRMPIGLEVGDSHTTSMLGLACAVTEPFFTFLNDFANFHFFDTTEDVTLSGAYTNTGGSTSFITATPNSPDPGYMSLDLTSGIVPASDYAKNYFAAMDATDSSGNPLVVNYMKTNIYLMSNVGTVDNLILSYGIRGGSTYLNVFVELYSSPDESSRYTEWHNPHHHDTQGHIYVAPFNNSYAGIQLGGKPDETTQTTTTPGVGAVFEPTALDNSAVGTDASGSTVYTPDYTKAITIRAYESGVDGQVAGVTLVVKDSEGNIKRNATEALNSFSETVRAENASEDNALIIHTGTKANQAVKVYLTDMRSVALGLKGSDGKTLSIGTQAHANTAINVLDCALQKALNEETRLGAYISRLEYTAANLTTSNESTQASESTIRDADMAKEMAEYTKANVLAQAAQSMLAQANQNSSSVLGLLQ